MQVAARKATPVARHSPLADARGASRLVVDLTLLAACTRGNRRTMGHALINERILAKPVTPLTRHWIEALDEGDARARL